MPENDKYYYAFNMDHGTFSLNIPTKVSEEDCKDMEAHFEIIMRQARRRGEPSDAR